MLQKPLPAPSRWEGIARGSCFFLFYFTKKSDRPKPIAFHFLILSS